MTKWKLIIEKLADDGGFSCDFYPSVTQAELETAEKTLSILFPLELRELLIETNGVMENLHHKNEVIPNIQLIWSLETIVDMNLRMRTDPIYEGNYLPLNNFLFFAAPGVDGVLYGYGINRQGKIINCIYQWEPIGDYRISIARNLENFLKQVWTNRKDDF